MKNELVIGRVRTAHGVRGELKVESISGETQHFRTLERVALVRGTRREEMGVEAVRVAHRTVLLKLEGVETPEQAKRWRGWEVVVPRELAAPLGEDEFYFADLVGLDVVAGEEKRGTVENLWEGGKTALLGIRLEDGEQRLVPFQAEFVEAVDLERGRIVLTTDEVLT